MILEKLEGLHFTPQQDFFSQLNAEEKLQALRGMIRPDVTLYGEALPKNAVNKANNALQTADMLIIAGTSLQVEPAASMIWLFQGKYMVYINLDTTSRVPNYCDLVFNQPISEIFTAIAKEP